VRLDHLLSREHPSLFVRLHSQVEQEQLTLVADPSPRKLAAFHSSVVGGVPRDPTLASAL
jgi:hypothetical protein